MREFNEGSALTVTARFRTDNSPVIPTTVHYQLRNVTNDRIVTDWTSVSPASDVEIDISAQSVAIVGNSKRYEIQEVTIVADKDTANQTTNVERWRVKKLQAFS